MKIRTMLLLLIGACLLDGLSLAVFMAMSGGYVEAERNPVTVNLLGTLGITGFLILKFGLPVGTWLGRGRYEMLMDRTAAEGRLYPAIQMVLRVLLPLVVIEATFGALFNFVAIGQIWRVLG